MTAKPPRDSKMINVLNLPGEVRLHGVLTVSPSCIHKYSIPATKLVRLVQRRPHGRATWGAIRV